MTPNDRQFLRAFPVVDFAALDPDRLLWFSSVLSDMAPAAVNRDSGRAFYDMCSHRKAAILNGASQDRPRLRCPYHGWTFGEDGSCPNGALSLVDQISLGGLSLLSADAARIDPDEMEDAITVFDQFRWLQIKPLARRTYSVRSQLCIVESYIAALSSGNFSALGDIYNVAGRELVAMGAHRPLTTDWDPDSVVPIFIDYNALVKDHGAATQSGDPIGPPITVFDQHSHVFYYGAIGPLFHFSLYFDHIFLTNFHPVGESETVIECCWMAHEDATESEETIIWLWENTMLQDIELVTRLHVGRSHFPQEKPVFLDSEEQSASFNQWVQNLPDS